MIRVLLGVYVFAYLMSNFLAPMTFQVGWLTLSYGVLLYPITFLITDIISECSGLRKARSVYWFTLWFSTLVFTFGLMSGLLGAEYVRVIIASLIAYFFAQKIDINVYHRIKSRPGGAPLWLKNNASTMLAQVVDTYIFATIVFIDHLMYWEILVSHILIKIAIAIIDTPICYLGVRLLRGKL